MKAYVKPILLSKFLIKQKLVLKHCLLFFFNSQNLFFIVVEKKIFHDEKIYGRTDVYSKGQLGL